MLEFNNVTLFTIAGFEVRLVFVIAVIVVLALQFALARLRWGRRIYAIGSNPSAAAQAGLAGSLIWSSGRLSARGALAGLAGFMFLARAGTISATAGAGLELESVAAAVVGGVSILGGSGTMVGAFLGAIFIDTLKLSLVRVPEVSEFWRDAFLGILILAAVILDTVLRNRFNRRWSAEARKAMESTGPPRWGWHGWPEEGGPPMRDWAAKHRWESILIVVLVATIVVNVSLSPFYLGFGNFVNLFWLSIEKIIVVVVMTFVIINGEIDLSVASVMGFSAAVMATLYEGGRSRSRSPS